MQILWFISNPSLADFFPVRVVVIMVGNDGRYAGAGAYYIRIDPAFLLS